MSGMPELKQALVEIVAIAEKYDLGMGVTLSNQDCARYLFRLPSWSIVRAAVDGAMPASVRLKDGEQVVGAYDVDLDMTAPDIEQRIEGSLHSLQSSADNMRRYADTIDGILSGVLRLLAKRGIEVAYADDVDEPHSLNVLPQPPGKPN